MARRSEAYMYGSAARQLETTPRRKHVPEQQPKRAIEKREKPVNTIVSKQNAMFMIVALSIMAVCLVGYIYLQASIVNHSINVTSLQRQISSLTLENDAAESVVDESVNLDSIKERAVQLGMVYATGNQVIEYTSPTQDYVKQYENIPENGIITSARAASE